MCTLMCQGSLLCWLIMSLCRSVSHSSVTSIHCLADGEFGGLPFVMPRNCTMFWCLTGARSEVIRAVRCAGSASRHNPR